MHGPHDLPQIAENDRPVTQNPVDPVRESIAALSNTLAAHPAEKDRLLGLAYDLLREVAPWVHDPTGRRIERLCGRIELALLHSNPGLDTPVPGDLIDGCPSQDIEGGDRCILAAGHDLPHRSETMEWTIDGSELNDG